MKLCCFVTALAFVVLFLFTDFDCQFLITCINCGCLHVHKGLIWCEIYLLSHAELLYIDKHKRDLSKGGRTTLLLLLENTCMQKPSPTKPLYFPNVKYLK
jgi:hypothetical protein